jgi:hypothetical protein
MPKLQLFDYTVLYHFKSEKDNAGNDVTKDSLVVISSAQMLAPNSETVSKKAARLIPEKYENELNQCEIIVRPF